MSRAGQRVVALMPMKGHSERVADKNMRPFAGRPLYHATMCELLSSPRVDRVIVNTDSVRIAADVSAHFPRALVVIRPEAIRGDLVSMNDVIAYDVDTQPGEHFLQTHSTNPLLTAATITAALDTYFDKLDGFDAVVAVTRIQARLYHADGRPINHTGSGELQRTQDLPPVFQDASAIYAFSRESFYRAGRNRMGTRPFLFEMSRIEAIDIDDEDDFTLAEVCYRGLRFGAHG